MNQPEQRGHFISFEGIEGVGKSTQILLAQELLEEKGYEVVVTKEPGGTDFGLKIREMILSKDTVFHSPYTEILLFIADRLEHVESVIKPALAAGKVVLCDRYIDSTIAYQLGGRKMPRDLIDILHQYVNCMPQLTVLLDLDPEEGLRRAKNRAELDRFENEELSFHYTLRETYLSQAEREPDRIKTVSCQGLSKEVVFGKVREVIEQYLGSVNHD